MPADIKDINQKMQKLECYKRYIVHRSLQGSDVYFGQPPILDYLTGHGECTQKELSDAIGVSAASVAVFIY